MTRLPWTFVALALVLAGCAAEPVVPASTVEPPPAEGKAFVERLVAEDGSYTDVYESSGVVTGYAWLHAVPDDAPLGFDVPLRDGVRSVRVTVTWEGTADFDAVLQAPEACQSSSQAPPPATGLDCSLMRSATKESADGWFHAGGLEEGESVLELDGETVAAWNECAVQPCRWHAMAYFNAATQTPFTLRAEVVY